MIPKLLKDYFDYYKVFNVLFSNHKNNIEFTVGKLNTFGYNVVVQLYLPKGKKVNKYLIYTHGYFDHSGVYGKLITILNKNNIGVVVFDLPGHGLSPGKIAEISDFGEYVRVLDGVINDFDRQICVSNKLDNDKDLEFYLMGYSTGAAVVMEYLMHNNKLVTNHLIKKVVLCAPLVRIVSWKIGKILLSLLKNITYLKRNYELGSHDIKFAHFIKYNDPLQGRYVSVSWIKAMSNWNDRFKYYGINSQVQIGILQGDADTVVDWHYNVLEIMRKFPNSRLQYIKGAYHNLLNEDKKYLSIVDNWLIKFLEEN